MTLLCNSQRITYFNESHRKKKSMVSLSFSHKCFSFEKKKEVNLKVNQIWDYLNVYFLSCVYVGVSFVINSNKMLLELITSWYNISNKKKRNVKWIISFYVLTSLSSFYSLFSRCSTYRWWQRIKWRWPKCNIIDGVHIYIHFIERLCVQIEIDMRQRKWEASVTTPIVYMYVCTYSWEKIMMTSALVLRNEHAKLSCWSIEWLASSTCRTSKQTVFFCPLECRRWSKLLTATTIGLDIVGPN